MAVTPCVRQPGQLQKFVDYKIRRLQLRVTSQSETKVDLSKIWLYPEDVAPLLRQAKELGMKWSGISSMSLQVPNAKRHVEAIEACNVCCAKRLNRAGSADLDIGAASRLISGGELESKPSAPDPSSTANSPPVFASSPSQAASSRPGHDLHRQRYGKGRTLWSHL
jgi:hypothetical protein